MATDDHELILDGPYRACPGGMLSDKGRDEMYDRFKAGQSDNQIAKAMGFMTRSVTRRRKIRLEKGK